MMTTQPSSGTFYDRKVLNILMDSLFLASEARRAEEQCKSLAIGAFSRASILSMATFVEGVSNCLVDSIGFHKGLGIPIERLGVLEKFDLFFFFRAKRGIDQGDSRYAKMRELKKFRDDFVHPKASATQFTATNEHCRVVSVERRHRNLRISQDSQNVRFFDALKCIQAVNEFLTWILIEEIGLTLTESRFLLNSEDAIPGGANELPTPFFTPN